MHAEIAWERVIIVDAVFAGILRVVLARWD